MPSSRLVPLAFFVALAACTDGPPPGPTELVLYEPAPGTPARIAWDEGLTRHLGEAAPSAILPQSATETTFEFDPADGPVCMRGGTFRATVRETPSDDLVIFLQGGGACWSAFCLAITAAPEGIPPLDIFRPNPANPLATWDVLYLPYCDGSLFAGDHDIDEDGDGTPDRLHHGLANLSAALTVGYSRFPHPRRVVLAGASGGGFGTILASFLVRYVYPDAPIYVIDDAGVGVARAGDVAYLDTLIDEFGARDFLPDDCPDCIADGHITGLVDYLLDHDPNLRFAAISSYDDYVISQIFLQTTSEAFRSALVSETDALHAEHPDAYRRFFYAGAGHTVLLGDVSGIIGYDITAVELPDGILDRLGMVEIMSMRTLAIGDAYVTPWLAAMVEGDLAGWPDLLDDPGPLPAPAP